jgi:hypothetical protein
VAGAKRLAPRRAGHGPIRPDARSR